MIHAITLLVIMLFAGKWAALIPMPTLAGILVVVAWNMSELANFRSVLKASKSDATVLITTFALTVLVDLTVAIEIGMILAAFLFMRKMMQASSVEQADFSAEGRDELPAGDDIPKGVDIFEINGPLFFGAAYKFKDAMNVIENPPRVLIIRMRNVPVIDATGVRVLREVYTAANKQGTKLVLSEIASDQVMGELQKARLLFQVGKGNVSDTLVMALKRANAILADNAGVGGVHRSL
jgi:SulP family sulfate permease